jgi:hypothetical protein
MLPYGFPMRRVRPRARPSPALVGAVAALALVATACTTQEQDPAPRTDVSEVAEAVEVESDRYVALGDSYTAAPLRPKPERIRGCLRGKHNYPRLVAEALEDTELVDVSCSGASTDSMFGKQAFDGVDDSRPPQLDAVTPDTDLVTVSIGANDFGLFSSMILVCLRVGKVDPDGAPCRRQAGPAQPDDQANRAPRDPGHRGHP